MTFSILTIQKYIRGWMARKNTQDLRNKQKPTVEYNENSKCNEFKANKDDINISQCLNRSNDENKKLPNEGISGESEIFLLSRCTVLDFCLFADRPRYSFSPSRCSDLKYIPNVNLKIQNKHPVVTRLVDVMNENNNSVMKFQYTFSI